MIVAASTQSRTFESAEALAQGVAEWLCALAQATDRDFAVCLSGGSTPRRLYERLAAPAIASRFPWTRSHWFWGDERFVPYDDPASNYRMTKEAMLSHVPVPPGRIHPMPVDGTPEDAAVRYETLLKRIYGTDEFDPTRPLFHIMFLGLGDDGHTASLIPGQPVLEERKRWVAAVTAGRAEARITLTYPAIESSRTVAFLATGAEKTAAVRGVRSGNQNLPAARIRPQGEVIWFLDRAAAGAD